MTTYTIYPIPNDIRGSDYLKLFHASIEGASRENVRFAVKKFSWKELLLSRPNTDEKRVIHIHWETNIYGSEYILVSIVRMIYRFIGLWLAKLRGARILWTVHNLRAHDYPHPRIDAFGRSIMWRIADAATIQQKSYAKQEISRRKSPQIYYIPHPNFIGTFGPLWKGNKEEARKHCGITSEDIALLAFGSVRPYKELPTLIDAVTVARARGAHVVLLIAGKASKEYAQIIIEKAKDNPGVILRLGFVENHEIPEYLAASDYSILYYSESSLNSGPLLVSLSYGVPVITRDMPASEVIVSGKNGFTFHDQRELEDMLVNLKKLDVSDKGAIMGTAGPSWPDMAQELARAYRALWP